MIRFLLFLAGFALFLLGAADNFDFVDLPVNLGAIVLSIGPSGLSLDVILMIVGVFMMGTAWIFHRLNQ